MGVVLYFPLLFVHDEPFHLVLQWCVLLPVVLTLIANQDKDTDIARYVGKFCYPKWALEAFVVANAERYCNWLFFLVEYILMIMSRVRYLWNFFPGKYGAHMLHPLPHILALQKYFLI